MYIVTRYFTNGLLKGMTHTGTTNVYMRPGWQCNNPYGGTSSYRILRCTPVRQREHDGE
jgi:hypothetical protein